MQRRRRAMFPATLSISEVAQVLESLARLLIQLHVLAADHRLFTRLALPAAQTTGLLSNAEVARRMFEVFRTMSDRRNVIVGDVAKPLGHLLARLR